MEGSDSKRPDIDERVTLAGWEHDTLLPVCTDGLPERSSKLFYMSVVRQQCPILSSLRINWRHSNRGLSLPDATALATSARQELPSVTSGFGESRLHLRLAFRDSTSPFDSTYTILYTSCAYRKLPSSSSNFAGHLHDLPTSPEPESAPGQTRVAESGGR